MLLSITSHAVLITALVMILPFYRGGSRLGGGGLLRSPKLISSKASLFLLHPHIHFMDGEMELLESRTYPVDSELPDGALTDFCCVSVYLWSARPRVTFTFAHWEGLFPQPHISPTAHQFKSTLCHLRQMTDFIRVSSPDHWTH